MNRSEEVAKLESVAEKAARQMNFSMNPDALEGRPSNSDRGVGMYLMRMGSYPLLDGMEQIEIAKQMVDLRKRVRRAQRKLMKMPARGDNKRQALRVISFTESNQETRAASISNLAEPYRTIVRTATACQAKAEELKRKLIIHNLRLVVSLAKKRYHRSNSFDFIDLVQEGNIGLLNAVDKYDPGRINPETKQPYRFSTMATWWINQQIGRFIEVNASSVKYPVHIIANLKTIQLARIRFRAQTGREPTMTELLENTNLRMIDIQNVLKYRRGINVLSLDAPVNNEKDPSHFGDFIPDTTIPRPDEFDDSDVKKVQILLSRLDERQRQVITLCFGLGEYGRCCSLEEVGKMMNVSRERVRQIRNLAFSRMLGLSKEEHEEMKHRYSLPYRRSMKEFDIIQYAKKTEVPFTVTSAFQIMRNQYASKSHLRTTLDEMVNQGKLNKVQVGKGIRYQYVEGASMQLPEAEETEEAVPDLNLEQLDESWGTGAIRDEPASGIDAVVKEERRTRLGQMSEARKERFGIILDYVKGSRSRPTKRMIKKYLQSQGLEISSQMLGMDLAYLRAQKQLENEGRTYGILKQSATEESTTSRQEPGFQEDSDRF